MMLVYLILPFVCSSTFWIVGLYALVAILALLIFLRLNRDASGPDDTSGNSSNLLSHFLLNRNFRVYGFVIFTIWSTIGSMILFQQENIRIGQISYYQLEIEAKKNSDEILRKSGLMSLMSQTLDQVSNELSQHNSHGLSEGIIQRISRLSYAFHPEPFQYLEPDSGVYCIERGLLLIALARMPIDSASFSRIKQITDFSGADLKASDLHGLNLSGAQLIGANFQEANLRSSLFKHADLRGANFWGAKMNKADLSYAFLNRANAQWAEINDARLIWATLKETDLSSAKLRNSDLSYAIMDLVDLGGASLRDAQMVCASLTGANLDQANLTGVNLDQADLRLANLCDANLSGAHLNEVILNKTRVREPNWLQQLNLWQVQGTPAMLDDLEVTADEGGKNQYLITVKRK
ncbi:MAG: pentapeptide repeat-containing protein [Saprospiraceae bacterium]|nr:pentapeptide repeat-containing protein [Saprospiraceae bacterium]MCB9319718.1 pentapeptide repeat-containing protein [Lewinellaceae bacterium]